MTSGSSSVTMNVSAGDGSPRCLLGSPPSCRYPTYEETNGRSRADGTLHACSFTCSTVSTVPGGPSLLLGRRGVLDLFHGVGDKDPHLRRSRPVGPRSPFGTPAGPLRPEDLGQRGQHDPAGPFELVPDDLLGRRRCRQPVLDQSPRHALPAGQPLTELGMLAQRPDRGVPVGALSVE